MNESAVIEVKNFSKSYGDFAAVRDLSFNVGQGEIVGLVGMNGAGKTTTLRAITGILRPTSGTVSIGGHNLEDEAVEAVASKPTLPSPNLVPIAGILWSLARGHITLENHARELSRSRCK